MKTVGQGTVSNVQVVDSAFRWAVHSTNPAIIYLGSAETGSLTNRPVWRISEVNTTTGSFKYVMPDGYYQVWDNREALTYE